MMHTVNLPTIACAHCDGTGQVPDSRKIGIQLRSARKKHRVGLREIARRLELSSGYLHDLEHGRRNWTEEMIRNYQAALGPLGPLIQ